MITLSTLIIITKLISLGVFSHSHSHTSVAVANVLMGLGGKRNVLGIEIRWQEAALLVLYFS